MLLPELNEKATRENVKNLLGQYHSLRRLAGEQYEQKLTANYTLEPKGSGGISRPVENVVARKMTAIQIIENIHQALNCLSKEERQLLWNHYTVNIPSDYEIIENYSISPATYYRKLEKAQLSFAEVYSNGQLLIEVWIWEIIDNILIKQ